MSDAAIGLIGALIGGVLTGASAWLVEWRRDRRQESRDVRADDRALRRAVRLIALELMAAQSDMESARDDEAWWPRPGHELSTVHWIQNASALADSDKVDDLQWGCVSTAYLSITDANAKVESREHAGPLEFTDDDATFLIGAEGSLAIALVALEDVAAGRSRNDFREYYRESRRRRGLPEVPDILGS